MIKNAEEFWTWWTSELTTWFTEKFDTIKTAIAKGGGNPSKMAYESMKRVQEYLYEIEYSEIDYEAARKYFATHFVPVSGACTALRKGDIIGRNYDWTYSKEVSFLVRTKAHNGRYASIGMAGSIAALTTDTIGEYSEEFRYMPFRLLDGLNEKGVYANVNMLNNAEGRTLPTTGTVPLIEERERICSAMLVRYILDNFATPQEACEYIRNYVAVYPPFHDGATTDLHFSASSKEQLYYLCFEQEGGVWRTMYVDVKNQPLPFVMTNFRMWWAQYIFDTETGHYDRTADPDYDYVEKYGMGIERANLCLDFVRDTETSQSVLDFMCANLAYTRSYLTTTYPLWLTEFVGQYSEEDLARDSAAEDFERILGIVRQRYAERSRETALTWQTVHSVTYDLEHLTMQLVVQEGSAEDALTIDCFKSLPATKEDVGNIDLSSVAKESTLQCVSDKVGTFTDPTETVAHKLENLTFDKTDLAKEATTAKQGNNPNATNSAILAAIDPIGTAATAYNEGKPALAAAITTKGQATEPTATLAQMAENVRNITLNNYELSAQEVKDTQNYADGTLYDLYEVFYQIKNDPRYQNNYACFILCEYFRGYDSLILQNADGYLTCDGDYYDGAVTHIWHDENTGKADRWVAYLFRNDGASYQIPDTARCPRSMYIGGNIGQIQCLFAGRIYEVVVPDEVVNGVQVNTLNDLYFSSTQVWQKNVVIKNIKEHKSGYIINGNSNVVTLYFDGSANTSLTNGSNPNLLSVVCNAKAISPNATIINVGSIANLEFPELVNSNLGSESHFAFGKFADNCVVRFPKLEAFSSDYTLTNMFHRDTKGYFYFNSLKSISGNSFFGVGSLGDGNGQLKYILLGCKGNKNQSIILNSGARFAHCPNCFDLEIGDKENIDAGLEPRWYPCQNLNITAFDSLIETNILNHILNRLKADEAGCGSGVTITLGSTNLAKLTSAESLAKLEELTNTYGYTFA